VTETTVRETLLAVRTRDDWDDPHDRVAQALGSLEVAGVARDGEQLGHRGWLVVRTIGDPDAGTVACWDERHDALGLLTVDEVAAYVGDRLGTSVATWRPGTGLVADGAPLLPDAQEPEPWSAVAVVPRMEDLDVLVAASAAGVPLRASSTGAWTVLGSDRPDADDMERDLSGRLLAAASTARLGLVVWRLGPGTGLWLVDRSGPRLVREWGLTWSTFGPAAEQRLGTDGFSRWVLDFLDPVPGDGAELVEAFGLTPERARDLRAALRRPEADLHAVLAALDLPEVAADVAAGHRTMESLATARTYDPLPPRRLFMDGVRDIVDDASPWALGLQALGLLVIAGQLSNATAEDGWLVWVVVPLGILACLNLVALFWGLSRSHR
jgi:hypothetical protein